MAAANAVNYDALVALGVRGECYDRDYFFAVLAYKRPGFITNLYNAVIAKKNPAAVNMPDAAQAMQANRVNAFQRGSIRRRTHRAGFFAQRAFLTQAQLTQYREDRQAAVAAGNLTAAQKKAALLERIHVAYRSKIL